MYTIDASVWVNGFDQREPGYEFSRDLLNLLATRSLPVFIPNLVLAEVAGAISRTRNAPEQAPAFANSLSNLPNVTFLPLDMIRIRRALALAANQGLRGADSLYAAVAVEANCTLITLDNEHLTRLIDIVPTCTPRAALENLQREEGEEGNG